VRRKITLTYDGKTMTLFEWAKAMKMDPQLVRNRLALGWEPKRIFTQPVKAYKPGILSPAPSGSAVCKHRGIGAAYAERKKPHAICDECRELSVDKGHSDFWLCCQCLSLVPYDRAKRRAAVQEENRLKRATVIACWSTTFERRTMNNVIHGRKVFVRSPVTPAGSPTTIPGSTGLGTIPSRRL